MHFSKNDYHQFIGRAGRRGLDKEGVIYCNVDWKDLMKGELGDVIGKKNILYNYALLTNFTSYIIRYRACI